MGMAATTQNIGKVNWEARGGRQESMAAMTWRRFRKHKPAMFSAAILTIIVVGCVFVPLIFGYDPYNAPVELRRQPPSIAHLFGTDELGRDLLMRIWVGGRVSLVIGVAAMLLSITIGTFVGAVAKPGMSVPSIGRESRVLRPSARRRRERRRDAFDLLPITDARACWPCARQTPT